MNISFHTVCISFLIFNFCIVIIYFLRKNKNFIMNYGANILYFIILISIARLVLAFEFSFTNIIRSEGIYPYFMKILNYIISFKFLGRYYIETSVLFILLGVSISISVCLYYFQMAKYFRSCNKVKNLESSASFSINEIYKNVVKSYNMKNTPILIQTRKVSIPQIRGIFIKQYILLPDKDYTDDQLTFIFKHELTHSRKKDNFLKYFINVICISIWWNPIVYLLKKDLEQVLEIRCDLSICKGLADDIKISYLNTIINVMEQSKSFSKSKLDTVSSAFITKNKSDKYIKQRFEMVLSTINEVKSKKRFNFIIVFAVIVMFMLSYTFVIQPYSVPNIENVNNISTYVDSTNSYILQEEGVYNLYVNQVFLECIDEGDLQSYILSQVPIFKEDK